MDEKGEETKREREGRGKEKERERDSRSGKRGRRGVGWARGLKHEEQARLLREWQRDRRGKRKRTRHGREAR